MFKTFRRGSAYSSSSFSSSSYCASVKGNECNIVPSNGKNVSLRDALKMLHLFVQTFLGGEQQHRRLCLF